MACSTWSRLLVCVCLLTASNSLDIRRGPDVYQPPPLGELPSPQEDLTNVGLRVSRLLPSVLNKRSAHACDQGIHANKATCLSTEGRACMWTNVETRNPLLAVQQSESYCLPCEIDGTEIPCWNTGAWIDDRQVTECVMSCKHQRRIWQPQYACSDGNGVFISQSLCFDRGRRSGSKCMFVQYEDENGQAGGSCGPCALDGSGAWGCPAAGAPGPEDGTKVTGCLSQCDMPCGGGKDCPTTVPPPFVVTAPPTLPPPQSPGVGTVDSEADAMLSAPGGFLPEEKAPPPPTTTAPPMIQKLAAKGVMAGAGYWALAKTYDPVILYRTPGDDAATTLTPPPMWPPAWWPSPK